MDTTTPYRVFHTPCLSVAGELEEGRVGEGLSHRQVGQQTVGLYDVTHPLPHHVLRAPHTFVRHRAGDAAYRPVGHDVKQRRFPRA